MVEIIANIHIHTAYSDGSKLHRSIANDAIRAGVDVLFVTDHNVHIQDIEGYYENQSGKVLIIMGEEIHDLNANPQKNHMLALGTSKSLAQFADRRKTLIDEIHSDGGLSFIAHPNDPAMPVFNESAIPWKDWSVKGYSGIELWNGFSELKVRAHTKAAAYFYVFFPKFLPFSPPQETVKIWDELLAHGEKVIAIGGSDAHASYISAGFLKHIVFPYSFHFQTIRNHILLESQLSGNAEEDKRSILNALRNGHLFIANDLIKPARGFQFFIQCEQSRVVMGETCKFGKTLKMHVDIPHSTECLILKNGKPIHRASHQKTLDLPVDSPGVYRVECYSRYLGRKRGWIFSNPIYIN